MHIGYKEIDIPKEELIERDNLVLEILKENSSITLEEVATKMGKSVRTIKVIVKKLQDNGKLERVGGKKIGHWKVN
jgi:ATP-dependent DNA helicase RecG